MAPALSMTPLIAFTRPWMETVPLAFSGAVPPSNCCTELALGPLAPKKPCTKAAVGVLTLSEPTFTTPPAPTTKP